MDIIAPLPSLEQLRKRRILAFCAVFVVAVSVAVIMHNHQEYFTDAFLYSFFAFCLILMLFVFDAYMSRREARALERFWFLEDYRRLVNSCAGAVKTDPSGIILTANDRFCEMTGFSLDEVIGRSHNIVRHPEMPSAFYREMWLTLREGKPWRGVIKNRDKSGRTYFADSSIVPLFRSDGAISGYMAISYDVTQMQDLIAAAKEAQATKDRFLATMSHEIRTPLNAIFGFVEILEERALDGETREFLRTIKRSSSSLLEIINDVLDFAKIESGLILVDRRPCDLRAEISAAFSLFKANASAKGVILREFWSDSFPQCVIADSFRARQIVSNLLSNAIKFTPQGKLVTLLARYENGMAEFVVEDEGIGVAPEWQKKIFEAFSQVRAADATHKGGTGLGLSISLKLAQLLGGSITLKSKEREGSSFKFEFPAEICAEATIVAETEESCSVGKAIHALVAEDQADNQTLIRLQLARLGVTAQIVADGKDAVRLCAIESFDILLLDENMPVMNGSQALVEIREAELRLRRPHTPAAALTANAIKGDREKFIAAGFDDYLSKPISRKELAALIDRLMAKKAAYMREFMERDA